MNVLPLPLSLETSMNPELLHRAYPPREPSPVPWPRSFVVKKVRRAWFITSGSSPACVGDAERSEGQVDPRCEATYLSSSVELWSRHGESTAVGHRIASVHKRD